jgi:hypothetical protein
MKLRLSILMALALAAGCSSSMSHIELRPGSPGWQDTGTPGTEARKDKFVEREIGPPPTRG